MLATILALHFSLSAAAPFQRGQQTIVRDSTPGDSAGRNAPRRLPVTAAVLASAFHDAATRDLFNRARKARLEQDSSLRSYDSKVRQRLSVYVGIGKLGRDRLVYRHESAARVQWQRDAGVRIELTGARVAIPPIGSPKEERSALQDQVMDSEMSPIPYTPGSETLWASGDIAARTEVNDRSLVNPIAGGAEAYYTYATGDSVSFRLPDGRTIQLREMKVRPRLARPNVVVGSLWFDIATGQLVRAAYRLAVPASMTISVSDGDSTTATGRRIGFLLGALISPMTAQLSSIVVEYGLYEGRFWLPRSQSAEGFAQVTMARVPVKWENAFNYTSVNASLNLAAIQVDTTAPDDTPRFVRPPRGLDSTARRKWRDSSLAVYNAAVKARSDSVKAGMRVGSMRQCDTSTTRTITKYRSEARVPVSTTVPCDLDKLVQSPDLPTSIFDPGEDIFGSAEARQLASDALSMAAQAPISLRDLLKPRVQLGPSMSRYNRVEGFSTGVLVDQQLGGGYSATAIGRFGFSDQVPNVELSLARTNLSKTIRLNGYNRLVSANDWGSPLTFRSSVSTFLFGRDEGFYYRATGAELLWTTERGARLEWRAFAERERSALQRATFSLGANFVPNIDAASGSFAGGSVRFLHSFGVNPRRFRTFTDLRLEGAGGDSSYGRAAMDVTLSRALFGTIEAALTVSGGSSVGNVPTQRRWFLGGTQTIRGQSPDTAQSGNAFWMNRLELARANNGIRYSLFGDVGGAGDRDTWRDVGRPLSGVGVGISGLDGLIRFDIARGLYPRKQTRVSFYLGAPF
jgi:hypothetical protein